MKTIQESCPVCDSTKFSTAGKYRSNSAILSGKSKLECNQCGLIFISPLPSDDEWSAYNAGYFQNAHGNQTAAGRAQAFRNALAKIRVKHVRGYIKENSMDVKRALEIGPGYGEFVSTWLEQEPHCDYEVVETDTSMHDQLLSHGIKIATNFSEVDKKFDLVVASHVLEHTLEPTKFIQQIKEKLAPGGLVFIEVPCLDCHYKIDDEPHTLFFDKPALDLLLERLGFSKRTLSYHGKTHEQIIYQNGMNKISRIVEKLKTRLTGFLGLGYSTSGWAGEMSSLEWSVVNSFNAHTKTANRARWVRIIAQID